jgi:hypothetical protein
MLYGSEDALPLLTPNWDKRYVDLRREGLGFQQQSLPLGAIYILAPRSAEASAPFVAPVTGSAGLIEVVAETYVNYLLDKTMRAREFTLLGKVLGRVPLRRATPHSDPARLRDLCETIVHDFRALSSVCMAH